jgi:hypothetical protein
MTLFGQTQTSTPPRRPAPPTPTKRDLLSQVGDQFAGWGAQIGRDYGSVARDATNRVVSDFKPVVDADSGFFRRPSLNSYGHMASQNAQAVFNPLHTLDLLNYAMSPVNGAVHAVVAPYTRLAGQVAYKAGLPVGKTQAQAEQNVDAAVGFGGALGAMALNPEGVFADALPKAPVRIPPAALAQVQRKSIQDAVTSRLQAGVANLHSDPRTIEDLYDAAEHARATGADTADGLRAQADAAKRAFDQFNASSGTAFALPTARAPSATSDGADVVSNYMSNARSIGTRDAVKGLLSQGPLDEVALGKWAGLPQVRDGMTSHFGDRGGAFMDDVNDGVDQLGAARADPADADSRAKGWGYDALNYARGKIPSDLPMPVVGPVPLVGDAVKWAAGKGLNALYDSPAQSGAAVTQGLADTLPMAGMAQTGQQPPVAPADDAPGQDSSPPPSSAMTWPPFPPW